MLEDGQFILLSLNQKIWKKNAIDFYVLNVLSIPRNKGAGINIVLCSKLSGTAINSFELVCERKPPGELTLHF